MKTRSGTCACGAVSISVQGEPEINGICHCDNCKQRTGTAFGWSVYFPSSRVELSGILSVYDVPVEPPQRRRFCTRCGTTLAWATGAVPGLTGVAGGVFIDDPLPQPSASYRDSRRHHWLGLPDGCTASG